MSLCSNRRHLLLSLSQFLSVHQVFVGVHALPQCTGHSTMTMLMLVVVLICFILLKDCSPGCEALGLALQLTLIGTKPIT